MHKQSSAEYFANHLAICGKSQKDVAFEAGYTKPNIITMFKQGLTSIPVAAAPKLARAINVDPAHFLRIVMEEHHPDLLSTLEETLGGFATANESEFLKLFREATGNEDPPMPGKAARRSLAAAIKKAFL